METRTYYHSLSIDDKYRFIEALSPEAFKYFRYQSDIMLRPDQIVPEGDWRYCLFCGGRGCGKTKMAATEVRKRAQAGLQGIMIVAPTFTDLEEVMVPAVLAEFPENQARYKAGIIQTEHTNIMCKTTQQNNGHIRGRNTTFCWVDEVQMCWDQISEKQDSCFNFLDANIRKAPAQLLLTFTFENKPLIKRLFDLARDKPNMVKIMSSSMFKNDFLDKSAKDALLYQWKDTRYAKQELEGIVDFSADGALWNMNLLNDTRKPSIDSVANPPNKNNHRNYNNPLDFFIRFVVAIDPAMTVSETADETGIVVAGIGKDYHVYILEDMSGKWSPDQTTTLVMNLRKKYRNAHVVAESNQGGEWISYALRTKDPYIDQSLSLIPVSQGKMTRAQHIVILWDQKRAHLVGNHQKLEDQMCYYTGNPKEKSPDRFDAMVLAVQELMLERNMTIRNFNSLPRL